MAGEALVWCEVRKNIEILQLIVSVKQQERKQEGNHMCGDSRSTEITVSSNSVVVKREEKTSQHAKEEETDRCPREIRVTFPGKNTSCIKRLHGTLVIRPNEYPYISKPVLFVSSRGIVVGNIMLMVCTNSFQISPSSPCLAIASQLCKKKNCR